MTSKSQAAKLLGPLPMKKKCLDYVTMSESLRKFNSKGHRATHCHSGFDPASLERSSGPLELENYVGSLRYH